MRLIATLAICLVLSSGGVAQAADRPTPNDLAAFSDAVARNFLPWLERQPQYAGSRLDRDAGQVIVSLTEADPGVIAGLDARMPGGSDGWRLELLEYTWKQLRRAMASAWKLRSLPGARQLESTWIDVEENRVGLRFERGAIKRADIGATERKWERALGVPVYIWREEIAPSIPHAGAWVKLPDAPWGAANAVAVGVDGDMLVLDRETGRVLRFDPERNTWKRGARAPKPFRSYGASIWTGSELILPHTKDASRIATYDPTADRWRTRKLPPSPLSGSDAVVWADGRLVVADIETENEVDIERSLAMLDLDTGEWTELPAPEAPSQLVDLHWTGSVLLAVTTDEYEDLVQVTVLDLDDGEWGEPLTGPLSWWYRHSVWIGDRLLFSGGGEYGPSDASFDPVTMSWTEEDFDCPLDTREAIWTGELLISESSRYSLDPTTGTCYRFTGRDRTMNFNAVVWTGDRVIYWSGGGAEEGHPDPYRHNGHAFVFASGAAIDEQQAAELTAAVLGDELTERTHDRALGLYLDDLSGQHVVVVPARGDAPTADDYAEFGVPLRIERLDLTPDELERIEADVWTTDHFEYQHTDDAIERWRREVGAPDR